VTVATILVAAECRDDDPKVRTLAKESSLPPKSFRDAGYIQVIAEKAFGLKDRVPRMVFGHSPS